MIEIGVDFEPDSTAVTRAFVRLFHDVYRLRLSQLSRKARIRLRLN